MKNLSRVKILSNWVYRALSIGIVFIPIYYVSYWFLVNHITLPLIAVNTSATPITPHELPTEILAAGFISSLLPLTVLVFVLLNLRKIFLFYKDGVIFSFEHVILFKRTAKLLSIWVVLSVIYESVKSVLFSLNNPVGERVLSVGFGFEELTVIIVAAFIYVIAWVMDEGRALAEENQMTI
ncbi:DUF2975 domain-containing protein [Thiomicrorhabdus sp.]|uniref:DUF2975 domain-containing protein n=1 Tax=Thiomicrorhabdus sp. TaxID=2039724 RepID=UPI0029C912B6|nr:DUF2975 domain-containing protein [Thiomicrorhabdus sp.]